MKSDEFKKNMKDLIQNELIYNQIMSLFPEEMWKILVPKKMKILICINILHIILI